MTTWYRLRAATYHIPDAQFRPACGISKSAMDFNSDREDPPDCLRCRSCNKRHTFPPIPRCSRCGRPVPAGQGVVTWRGRQVHGHHAERCLDTALEWERGEVMEMAGFQMTQREELP